MNHGRFRRTKRLRQTGAEATDEEEKEKITINGQQALNIAIGALISGIVSGYASRMIKN